jgi:acyl dehydratase
MNRSLDRSHGRQYDRAVTATQNWPDFFGSTAAGSELEPTAWCSLSQLEVDLYGGLIADLDQMHNDPGWEPGRERWGGTIIIGTHALSMLPRFLEESGFPVKAPGVRFEVLSLPRVRFTAPLPIGHRARDRIRVADVAAEAPGTWTVRTEHTIEREGEERPFLYAELVTRFTEAQAG